MSPPDRPTTLDGRGYLGLLNDSGLALFIRPVIHSSTPPRFHAFRVIMSLLFTSHSVMCGGVFWMI